MTVEALPMLKPFAEAVAFQQQRVPMTRDAFDKLSNEAKLRAFTVAGLTKKSLVERAYTEAQRAIADGLTKTEFLEQLGGILDEQGGTLLSPRRLELIANNNFGLAYSAGRYAQLNDPDLLATRPYRQYPLGPDDSHTSNFCRKLQGLCWRAGDPIEPHIWPCKHHDCRHLQILSLTEEQAREVGIYVSPEGLEYPVIDGQTLLPDPGWDFSPGLLNADDRALVEAARAVGAELPAKTAADYALADLAAATELPAMPALTATAEWRSFANVFGIADGANGTTVLDVFGDGVRVSRTMFDAIAAGDMPLYARAIRTAIEDPYEVWVVARQRGDKAVFLKHYLGVFEQPGDEPLLVEVEEGVAGWLVGARTGGAADFEALRRGRLLLTKARRG